MSTMHEMKLQPKFFDFIKYGTKRIELRLYDDKRRNIELEDKNWIIKDILIVVLILENGTVVKGLYEIKMVEIGEKKIRVTID